MTFADLPLRAAFTWRDHFPDHVVMVKTGDAQHDYYRSGSAPGGRGGTDAAGPNDYRPRPLDDEMVKRRVRRWSMTRDCMDAEEIAAIDKRKTEG